MKQGTILFLCCCYIAGWAQQHDKDAADSAVVFSIVEQMPEFPGGEKGLKEYLASVPYPDKTKEGTVYVRFVIDTAGNVTNAAIARGVDEILDNIALEHVRQMPAWKPGRQRGRLVRVQYVVPFIFKAGTDDAPNKKKSGKK